MFSVLRCSLNCVGTLLAGIELTINGSENGIKNILQLRVAASSFP